MLHLIDGTVGQFHVAGKHTDYIIPIELYETTIKAFGHCESISIPSIQIFRSTPLFYILKYSETLDFVWFELQPMIWLTIVKLATQCSNASEKITTNFGYHDF